MSCKIYFISEHYGSITNLHNTMRWVKKRDHCLAWCLSPFSMPPHTQPFHNPSTLRVSNICRDFFHPRSRFNKVNRWISPLIEKVAKKWWSQAREGGLPNRFDAYLICWGGITLPVLHTHHFLVQLPSLPNMRFDGWASFLVYVAPLKPDTHCSCKACTGIDVGTFGLQAWKSRVL